MYHLYQFGVQDEVKHHEIRWKQTPPTHRLVCWMWNAKYLWQKVQKNLPTRHSVPRAFSSFLWFLKFLLIKFYWNMVDLQCWISFRYTEIWISYTYTYIHPFFKFFSHIGHYRVLSVYFPVVYIRSLLLIYSIYSSVYISIPTSQFIPHSASSLVTISLVSKSLGLILFH